VSEIWTNSSDGLHQTLTPKLLLRDLRKVGKHFRHMRQEDAHEYLIHLLDFMHEEILKANNVKITDEKIARTTFIYRIFGGNLCNELKCSDCNYSSKTFNPFLDLSLDIGGGIKSVHAALQSFTKTERLTAGNEWKCEGCKHKVKVFKRFF